MARRARKRVADSIVTDRCPVCSADLAVRDTVWAAEGTLYCSKECGIHDFRHVYGTKATRRFNSVAEEVAPKDIGIAEVSVYGVYSEEYDMTTIYKDIFRPNDSLASTEVVGFYFGEPNDEDTDTFTGSLKTVY